MAEADDRPLLGCAGMRGPLDVYARRFDVLELDVLDSKKEPKPATMRKWRSDAGPNLRIAIVAPRAAALVKPSPALDAGLGKLLEAQRLLQAQHIVLNTPIDVTPGALNRERLAALVARIREGLGEAQNAVRIAWAPRGVWENEDAVRHAESMDVELALDPLADPREPFWHSRMRYLRLSAVGGRMVFPPTRLRWLAEMLVEHPSPGRVVVFATPNAPKEARMLGKLLAPQAKTTGGGHGTVLRPRGAAALGREEEE